MGDRGVPRCRIAHGHHPHLGRHPSRDTHPLADRVSLNTLPRAVAIAICADGSSGPVPYPGLSRISANRRKLAEEPEESHKLRCVAACPMVPSRSCASISRSRCETASSVLRAMPQSTSRPSPRSAEWARRSVRGHVRVMQKCRLEAQEGNDLGPDAGLDRPPAPVLEIRLKVQMHEAIAQRPRHREVNTAIGGRIAGGDNSPAIGQRYSPSFRSSTSW